MKKIIIFLILIINVTLIYSRLLSDNEILDFYYRCHELNFRYLFNQKYKNYYVHLINFHSKTELLEFPIKLSDIIMHKFNSQKDESFDNYLAKCSEEYIKWNVKRNYKSGDISSKKLYNYFHIYYLPSNRFRNNTFFFMRYLLKNNKNIFKNKLIEINENIDFKLKYHISLISKYYSNDEFDYFESINQNKKIDIQFYKDLFYFDKNRNVKRIKKFNYYDEIENHPVNILNEWYNKQNKKDIFIEKNYKRLFFYLTLYTVGNLNETHIKELNNILKSNLFKIKIETYFRLLVANKELSTNQKINKFIDYFTKNHLNKIYDFFTLYNYIMILKYDFNEEFHKKYLSNYFKNKTEKIFTEFL